MNRSKAQSLYYQPERAAVWKLVAVVATGIVVAAGLSIPYAAFVYYCPLVYLSFFLPIGYGALIGLAVAYVARRVRLHRPGALVVIGTAAGVIGLYLGWINWMSIVIGGVVLRNELLASPAMLGRGIIIVLQTGTWSVGSAETFAIAGMAGRVNGLLLGLTWLGEAIAIVALAGVFAIYDGRGNAYCWRCRRYFSDPRWLHSYHQKVNPEQIRRRLELHDWASLGTLPLGSYGETVKFELCVQSCDGCGERHVLSLRRSTAAPAGKKRARVFETMIDRLLIEAEDLAMIKQYPPFDPVRQDQAC